MKYFFLLLSFIALNTLSAQQIVWDKPGEQTRKSAPAPTAAYRSAYNEIQQGYATYYADYLAGKPTAYGEIYKPGELTASHAVLPIGTILEVKRLDNVASVRVRVNDNNGHADGSLVVLSRRAAAELNFLAAGRARVSVKRVGFDNWNPKPVARPTASTMTTKSGYANNTTVSRPSATRYEQNRTASTSSAPSTYSSPYYRPASYSQVSTPTTTNKQPASTGNVYRNPYSPNGTYTAPRPQVGPDNSTVISRKGGNIVTAPARPVQYGQPQSVANSSGQNYCIQLAAYGNIENAQRQLRALNNQGVSNAQVITVKKANGATINRVIVGPFAASNLAEQAAAKLRADKQISGIVVRL